jgi:hypothetical protein
MIWRGGAANPPQTQADTSRTAAPSISSEWLVWTDGLQHHARSNIHTTSEAAAAAGVPWHIVAWTAKELAEAVNGGRAERESPPAD